MGRKKMDMKQTILDYLQQNGLELRQKFNLADARIEEDPVRLVLVTGSEITPEPLVHNGITIPVEIQKAEVQAPIIGKVEVEKGQEDQVFHHEFSDQAKKILNISEAAGPNVTEKDAKNKKAFESWKKRHKVVGE